MGDFGPGYPDSGTVQAFHHLDKADTFDVDQTIADADPDDFAAICHAPWTLAEAGLASGAFCRHLISAID